MTRFVNCFLKLRPRFFRIIDNSTYVLRIPDDFQISFDPVQGDPVSLFCADN